MKDLLRAAKGLTARAQAPRAAPAAPAGGLGHLRGAFAARFGNPATLSEIAGPRNRSLVSLVLPGRPRARKPRDGKRPQR